MPILDPWSASLDPIRVVPSPLLVAFPSPFPKTLMDLWTLGDEENGRYEKSSSIPESGFLLLVCLLGASQKSGIPRKNNCPAPICVMQT